MEIKDGSFKAKIIYVALAAVQLLFGIIGLIVAAAKLKGVSGKGALVAIFLAVCVYLC